MMNTQTKTTKASKRQKAYFKSSEIAHVWAHEGAPIGRCASHMSFIGPEFRSYSTTIARIIKHNGKRAFVIDVARFSNTTCGHQWDVRRAIPNDEQKFSVNCGKYCQQLDFTPKTLIQYYLDQASEKTSDSTSVYAHIRARDMMRKHNELCNALQVASFFELGTARLSKLIGDHRETYAQAHKLITEREARLQASAQARAEKKRQKRLLDTLAIARGIIEGKGTQLRDLPYDWRSILDDGKTLHTICNDEGTIDVVGRLDSMLREAQKDEIELWRNGQYRLGDWNMRDWPVCLRCVDGETVETSKGAHFSLNDAERTYRFAVTMRERGWHRNGEQHAIGIYRLDAVNAQGVVAGCHRVSWDEIERFAVEQGW